MKLTFCELWENMQQDSSPLGDDGQESKAMAVIRTGNNLDGDNFWDDFVQICNDSAGLAELLGTRPEEISMWASKIKEAQSAVEQADSQDSEKNQVMTTGGDDAPPDMSADPRNSNIPKQF